jgi:LmbE family N-acetylglucosaminyl deacetylase
MAQRVLCTVAHPDDETMLTGGVLAMLAERDAEIHLLCATRGEGGEVGDPPIVGRASLGDRREQELICAARVLGLRSVRFLGYVDPLVGEDLVLHAYTDRPDELSDRIVRAAEEIRPAMVLTHGSNGEYGHPAHIVTHGAVVAAHRTLRERGLAPYLYTFCAAIEGRTDRIFNDDDPAHIVLEVAPWLRTKARAAECHRTQHGLFYRNHPAARDMTEVVRTLEGLHRVWPPEGPDWPPLRPFRISQRAGCAA